MEIKFLEKSLTSNWFVEKFSQSKGNNIGDNLYH